MARQERHKRVADVLVSLADDNGLRWRLPGGDEYMLTPPANVLSFSGNVLAVGFHSIRDAVEYSKGYSQALADTRARERAAEKARQEREEGLHRPPAPPKRWIY